MWRDARILMCGDFNMVDADADCTTASSLISSQERMVWKEILDKLHCNDLWNFIGGHTIRFTFHSRSHKKAMSRLDRCYYSHIQNLDATSTMWIDATMLLSYHNPLLIDLRKPQWSSCIPDKLFRIPLRLNHSWLKTSMFKYHSWLKTSMFKSKVCNLIQYVLSLKISACMKWEVFVLDKGILRNGNSIAAFCTEHFRNLFAASYSSDEAWLSSVQELLAFTPRTLDSHMAAACEKSISEEEVFLALKLLKNGKAPGMDGITKEFVLAFWPFLKTLLREVSNEIWVEEKMPYSFKLGKVKLIPKLGIPKRI
ncbi:hypothetical protein KP509_23G062100 [Ceratopteris richardii]|uniref:Endonuclease/exonuclease/phosphatase domain-containing protein n=1 Tax=Ceratopteris richardii TaxID=49495 RepID=A0A8T2S167_CERRI|nr:hypothetical protein KP509_23G062100 [Ceratopteris richardii]